MILSLPRLLKLWSILFTGMALILLLIPAQVVAVLNWVGVMFGWTTELVLQNTRFYSALGVSLLVVLICIARYALANPAVRPALTKIFILSKYASSAVYLLALWQDQPAFAYFAAAVVDGGIGLVTQVALRHDTK